MASFNQVTIAGNVTRDPEVKYLQSGKAVCELGVAINERRKDQSGQYVDDTIFIDVTFWERTAEVAGQYLHKGSPVLIGGKLKMDSWEKDGKKFSKIKVMGNTLQMLGAKGDSTSQVRDDSNDYAQAPAKSAATPTDDIPFAWIGLVLGLIHMGAALCTL